MYVCICNAVTDHQIKESVAAGASSMTDLQDQLGVGTCCGCCTDLVGSFLSAAAVSSSISVTLTTGAEH